MKKYLTFSNILFLFCLCICFCLAFFLGGEKVWLICFSTTLGMIASKHASQGKYTTFIFDILSYIFYINVCLGEKNLGEMVLSFIIIFTHLFGLFLWRKNQNNNVVLINNICKNEIIFINQIAIFFCITYGLILFNLKSNLIILNAISTTSFLTGNYCCYRRSILQFYYWNFYEISYILIWLLCAIKNSPSNIIFVVGAVCELVFNFSGIIKWNKLKNNKASQLKIKYKVYCNGITNQ